MAPHPAAGPIERRLHQRPSRSPRARTRSAAFDRSRTRHTLRSRSRPRVGSTLGFAFADPADAAVADLRLPRTLARHAAVALALVTDQLSAERELAGLRAQEARAQHVRLDGRPRTADPADRAGRLPRPHPRWVGRRSGDPARVHGTRPRHRDDHRRSGRRPAGAVPAGIRALWPSPAGPSRWPTPSATWPMGWTRSPWTAGSRCEVSLPPRLQGGDRRPSARRAGRHEPGSQCPEIQPRRVGRWAWPAGSTGRSRWSPSAMKAAASTRRTGPASSSGSTGWPAMIGSPGPGSACRSRATWPGRWAASSPSRAFPGQARRSSWPCPGRHPSRPRSSPPAWSGRSRTRRCRSRSGAVLRGHPRPRLDGRTGDLSTNPRREGRLRG